MKFFEYGKENKKTLMIECGYLAKWYPGLMPFINEAKKKYHVIVQAYDGFNEDEPDSIFHSIVEEAQEAVDFITDNLDGKIDVLYGISIYSSIIYSALTKHQGLLAFVLGRTKESVGES